MPLNLNSTDEELAAALAADPNAHEAAVQEYRGLVATAQARAPMWGFPNQQANLIDNLLRHAQQQADAQINGNVQSLARVLSSYAPAEGAEVKQSIRLAILRAALAAQEVFNRLLAPATRTVELERLFREVAPGGSIYGSPFRPAVTWTEGQVVEPERASRLAYQAVKSWRERGVLAERVGDGLRLSGPAVNESDVATAVECKAEILLLLTPAVTV